MVRLTGRNPALGVTKKTPQQSNKDAGEQRRPQESVEAANVLEPDEEPSRPGPAARRAGRRAAHGIASRRSSTSSDCTSIVKTSSGKGERRRRRKEGKQRKPEGSSDQETSRVSLAVGSSEVVKEQRRSSTRKRRKVMVYQHSATDSDDVTSVSFLADTMKRWSETKARLGIERDDDLAKYLLNQINDNQERDDAQAAVGSAEKKTEASNGDDEPPQLIINKRVEPTPEQKSLPHEGSRVKSESPPPLVRTAEKEVQTSPWVPPTPPRPEINESTAKIEIANEMAGKVFSAMTDAEWCCHCDTRHLKSSEQSATYLKFEDNGREECPFQKPLLVFSDSVIDFSSKDSTDERKNESMKSYDHLDLSKSFAQLSLPECLEIADARPGWKVIAKAAVGAFTQFGPLQGEVLDQREIDDEFDMKDLWPIFGERNTAFVNTSNPEKSNWFRYVRPAGFRERRNVVSVFKNGEMYFVSTRDIDKGQEVLFWTDDPNLAWDNNQTDLTDCGGCDIRFAHPLHFRLHCSIFHDPEYSLAVRKYYCQVCGISVLGRENIVKHASSEHDGEGAYQCQNCKKCFLRLSHLETHKSYECCWAVPGRSRSLCTLCGIKFGQPQKLKVHMKRVHGGDKHAPAYEIPFKADTVEEQTMPGLPPRVRCTKCGRTFKNKSNLKIHMLTHSGVKPFSCKIDGCKTGFTTKQCLQFHYRKTHGLVDEKMPKIEREIPYTLSAYSGGLAKDEDYDSAPETNDEKAASGGGDGAIPRGIPLAAAAAVGLIAAAASATAEDPKAKSAAAVAAAKWNVTRRKSKMPIKRVSAAPTTQWATSEFVAYQLGFLGEILGTMLYS